VRRSEAGFSLVAVAGSIAIMMILMGVAAPSWHYVMQNMREEELIFRGGQIADAIDRYQKKNGNAPPVSLEVLVKGKYLRQAFKDPMTPKGQWRFVRPGEAVGMGIQPPGAGGRLPGSPATPQATPTPRPVRRGSSNQPEGIGPFIGVASTSQDKSLRIFNGRTRYDQWMFVAGQPRVVGKDMNRRTLPGVRRQQGDNPNPVR
jgi:type II secretory pathway pseudopilin PulG